MFDSKTELVKKDMNPIDTFTISLLISGINTITCAAYLVTKPEFIMGKGEDCDAVLSFSDEISREHAKICWDGKEYSLSDMGSTNGTFLNGKTLLPGETYTLRSGDRIGISTYLFSVEVLDR